MGPTADQVEAVKRHVALLNEHVNESKAIDWSHVSQILVQIIQMMFASHVK
jgi:hypothetical protein